MAVELKALSESIGSKGLKCLVHGPSGAGKTVLCGSCGEPTLIISAESGLLSLSGSTAPITVAEVQTIQDIMDVYTLIHDSHDYQWICLDSLSEIGEVVLSNEKSQTKDPRQAYGETVDQMGKLIRAFRDLPYNVLMTSKQERIKDEMTGSLLYCPSMPGQKLSQQLPYFFDFVFAYRVEKNSDDELVRVLQTNRDATHEAKDRSGKLDMYEAPNMAAIRNKVINQTEQPTLKSV